MKGVTINNSGGSFTSHERDTISATGGKQEDRPQRLFGPCEEEEPI